MIKLIDLSPINLQECDDCERDKMDWTHGHDHEASMADSELRSMISHASKIASMIEPGDELPGWVSAYITLAADYMHSVAQYMEGKMQEKETETLPNFAIYETESDAREKVEQNPKLKKALKDRKLKKALEDLANGLEAAAKESSESGNALNENWIKDLAKQWTAYDYSDVRPVEIDLKKALKSRGISHAVIGAIGAALGTLMAGGINTSDALEMALSMGGLSSAVFTPMLNQVGFKKKGVDPENK